MESKEKRLRKKKIKRLRNLLQEKVNQKLLISTGDIHYFYMEKNLLLSSEEINNIYSNIFYINSWHPKKRKSIQDLVEDFKKNNLDEGQLRLITTYEMTDSFKEIFLIHYNLWIKEVKNHDKTEEWLKKNNHKFDKHFVGFMQNQSDGNTVRFFY